MVKGINDNSVFTRTDPGDAAQKIPVQGTDGQDGYDVRDASWWGIKVQNDSDEIVAFEVHGYTFEDSALGEPIVLRSGSVAASGGTEWTTSRQAAAGAVDDRVSFLQVQVDPAAAATGDVKVVFQSQL